MGMIIQAFLDRVSAFQPATWFGHLIVAWVVWLAVDITPLWATAVILAAAVVVFLWREYGHYQKHRAKGHPTRAWLADGIGDMVGPLTVFAAAVSDPWVAHTVGLLLMGLGTVVWVGLGYSNLGETDA